MNFFGLDIGSESIKIVQLKREGSKFQLVGAGMTKTPGSGLDSEAEKDLLAVAEAIKKLKNDAKILPFQVVASLPERSVFTRVIDFPPMNEEEISHALKWELEGIVPFPLDETNYDWQIVQTSSLKTSILVAVSPKTLIDKYLHVLGLADLQPLALETEVLAITRALVLGGEERVKLIVDLGAKSTNIIATKKEEIILTRSIPTAGKAVTRAVSGSFSLEEDIAKEYIKTYGLEKEQLEGKMAQAILPVLETGINEIKKSLDFCREEKKEEINLILLVGGMANLPGLSQTIANRVGVEVQVANPFSIISSDEKLLTPFKGIASGFVVAVGLAMREV